MTIHRKPKMHNAVLVDGKLEFKRGLVGFYWWWGASVPDSTTLAGIAGPASILTYPKGTNAKVYINIGTRATPVWRVLGERT